jgi:hypothetical protein
MTIQMFDPTGDVAKAQLANENVIEVLAGKRVGYIFNMHANAVAFWKMLEQEVASKLHPSSVCRIYKQNTWQQAPKAEVQQLVEESEYVLVGVGA